MQFSAASAVSSVSRKYSHHSPGGTSHQAKVGPSAGAPSVTTSPSGSAAPSVGMCVPLRDSSQFPRGQAEHPSPPAFGSRCLEQTA